VSAIDELAVKWIVSTETSKWREQPPLQAGRLSAAPDVILDLENPLQTIEGFGASFNELGWTALSALDENDRQAVLRALFEPGSGTGLALCRMPVGANDFSRDWYSYDETPGDLDLADFSITNDRETLVPFIHAARRHQPRLKLWASPWSPPAWMKTNGHYAAAIPHPMLGTENGLREDQVGREGTDMFVQDEKYFAAYAAYFGRFIDAYRQLGIPIGMVMPQNEFNSPQVFPSCTWTPEGLARFLAHLGPAMAERAVEVFLGTLERPDNTLVDRVLAGPEVSRHVSGIGLQWHGREALPFVHRAYPQLRIYQTEQECGDGRNDWRHCRHAWTLMRRFLSTGTNAYMYWNMVLTEGGLSRWGWPQNSLVVVDTEARTYRFTHEYYLLKHVSRFVEPGARALRSFSYTGYENQLAFRNPDGSIVIIAQNDMSAEMPMNILIGSTTLTPTLPADSFSTIVVPAHVSTDQ
jgi:glucosylceramidase